MGTYLSVNPTKGSQKDSNEGLRGGQICRNCDGPDSGLALCEDQKQC